MAATVDRDPDSQMERARKQATRKKPPYREVIEGQHYEFQSTSRFGLVFDTKRGSDGWECDCEGFQYTGCCLHLGSVASIAEREGWEYEGTPTLEPDRPTLPDHVIESMIHDWEDLIEEEALQYQRDHWEGAHWSEDPHYGSPI